ncbi:MAG: outer membrane protein transport protein [Myxococcales bacterium]|jgi:long-chain fatty acid transport protein
MSTNFQRCLPHVLLTLLVAVEAHGAGLYFTERGVRPLSRGGAFVAGADDLGSIGYNPAGLAEAGSAVLFDFSWLNFTSQYTRQTQAVDSSGVLRTVDSPTVNGTTPFLPLPTLGASYAFGNKKQYVVALGAYVPYTPVASYPTTISGGAPSPSRYSLVSLDGSALAVLGGWFAFKPVEILSVGAGVEMLVGTFKSTVVFSANPADRLIGSPEDPKYDALSSLEVGPIFAPSANAGAILQPVKQLRIGVSGQLPFVVDAPAKTKVRLPTAAPFDNASQQGQDGNVRFILPGVLRIGVEVRPVPSVRIEVAYVREFWSMHRSIDMTPSNIQLYNVTGFPSPFQVGKISIPRNFQDSNSFRLGGEFNFKLGGYRWQGRAGANYETSAIPTAYVSPLTIDSARVTTTLGASVNLNEHWRLDVLYAHVFAADVTVSPSEAKVPRVNPVSGNPTATEAVNAGKYSSSANVMGAGVQYRF